MKFKGSLEGIVHVHTFDRCELLKTNMAAYQWHVFSFQSLHEDSNIFLFWLDLDFFTDITHSQT